MADVDRLKRANADDDEEDVAELSGRDRLLALGATAQPTIPIRHEEPNPAPELGRPTSLERTPGIVPDNSDRLQPLDYQARHRLPTISPGAPAGSSASDQAEIEKIQDEKANPYGSPENHPGRLGRIAHVLGRIGNVAGDILIPHQMQMIPGTDLNREARLQSARANLNTDAEREGRERLRGAQIENLESEVEARKNPQTGKTADEQALAARQRILSTPKDQQPDPKDVATWNAYNDEIKAKQEVKPLDESKQPIGDAGVTQHSKQLETLTAGMPAEQKKQFLDAYSVGSQDTHGVATKRLEDAKASATLSGSERDRALQRQIAERNHQDALNQHQEIEDRKTVQYKNKDGELVMGSAGEARAAGADPKTFRDVPGGTEDKTRQSLTQFSRWIDNAQKASDTMSAWDNEKDKKLAIAVQNAFFSHVGVDPFNVGVSINTAYIDAFQNNRDYAKMTPEGQMHMQNMAQLWSDAINLMKAETGGVPRGEHFLKLESAILPQADKTQAMNREALKQFEARIKKDSSEYARPTDMQPLGGVIPPDAQSRIRANGRVVGYKDKDGNIVRF